MSTEAIAALLTRAHATATQVATSGVVRDAAEAYAVQDLVWAHLYPGQRAIAWKVGAPNVETEPTASPVLGLHSGASALPGTAYHRIGVEAEIAYRFARDLPNRVTAYAFEEIVAAVGEVLVAIELCDTRLSDWSTASELWKLADFQNNGALVLGTGTAQWQAIDWRVQRAELVANGHTLVAATGVHPFGDPLRLLPWLVAHCARRTGGLRAGDVVTTGSWGGAHHVEPGCEVRARFAGVGEAAVSIRKN